MKANQTFFNGNFHISKLQPSKRETFFFLSNVTEFTSPKAKCWQQLFQEGVTDKVI